MKATASLSNLAEEIAALHRLSSLVENHEARGYFENMTGKLQLALLDLSDIHLLQAYREGRDNDS